jgi:predicted secreted protein
MSFFFNMGVVYSLSRQDNGKTFKIRKDDLVTVSLESNFSFGEEWRLLLPNNNNELLKIDGEHSLHLIEEKYNFHRPDIPGAGGMHFFAIEPVKTKNALLRFVKTSRYTQEILDSFIVHLFIS